MEKPKYSVHLFAGGGGGILADLLEGITPVCAVEIMEYQRTVLGLRFPGLPIWWTDVNFRNADGGQCVMPWLDLADDPAEWPTPLMQRITTRKTHRVHRIETLGNGQVPLCAAVAFIYGRAILRVALRLAA